MQIYINIYALKYRTIPKTTVTNSQYPSLLSYFLCTVPCEDIILGTREQDIILQILSPLFSAWPQSRELRNIRNDCHHFFSAFHYVFMIENSSCLLHLHRERTKLNSCALKASIRVNSSTFNTNSYFFIFQKNSKRSFSLKTLPVRSMSPKEIKIKAHHISVKRAAFVEWKKNLFL